MNAFELRTLSNELCSVAEALQYLDNTAGDVSVKLGGRNSTLDPVRVSVGGLRTLLQERRTALEIKLRGFVASTDPYKPFPFDEDRR